MPNMRLLTRREILAGAASVVVAGRVLRAQQQPLPRPPRPTFSTDVEVVNVCVTVCDKSGRIVRDLSKEEFTLAEDGRPQSIDYFFRESDLPLTIGLLVDTTPSESNMLDVERRASLSFLTRMLRPEMDRAFLVQYHTQVDLLQDLTSSREELEAALDRLETHGFANRGRGWGGSAPGGGGQGRSGGGGSAPPGGPGGYENALSDAVCLASEDIMRKQQGRKALFILGDGDHLGDRGEEAIAAAERADTMIYAIRIVDERQGANNGGVRLPGGVMIGGAPGGFGRGGGGAGGGRGGGPGGGPGGDMAARGKENLKKLAKQTGGAYFEVGKKESLDKIYGQIEEELRSQYSLGYTPDASAANGYRTIKVGVRRKGMVVRGREGYYPRARSPR
jgi:VWFA-related protein